MRFLVIFAAISACTLAVPETTVVETSSSSTTYLNPTAGKARTAVISSDETGDVQAAQVDAKVQEEDQARALQEQSELDAELIKQEAEIKAEEEKIAAAEIESANREKELSEVWASEEKNFNEVDAFNTANSDFSGFLTGNSPLLSKPGFNRFYNLPTPVISTYRAPFNAFYPTRNFVAPVVKYSQVKNVGQYPSNTFSVQKAQIVDEKHVDSSPKSDGNNKSYKLISTVVKGTPSIISPYNSFFAPGYRYSQSLYPSPYPYYQSNWRYQSPYSTPLSRTYINRRW